MKRMTRSRLFLLELTVDLLFFCVCAAVCLALLGRANTLGQQSAVLGRAADAAVNAAEAFQSAGGDPARTAALLGASWDGAQAVLTLPDACTLTLTPEQPRDGLHTAEIKVTQAGRREPAYSLTVRRYVREVVE
ncbi:hypothetical protein [Agathobaculum sp.]|uniref:hypothetical protein n=1 Tax=Agathobaculum sp. TaxID=2048138 RepID=UPI002A80EB14|nr:hypothetical protein [Agathobaculum sp.]MDY3617821.1 hypothetical protein [Agathobaculum sp.]